ncbi:3'(2'),5'-bisphosphate nucleotidase CysQ [Sansalvadorimonas sp. 2012CJ34-2]|uniref:3'(2'),5'-bisphosphate nucleotidase CysQ n=1 Tax=Parendozoicomonas callyspongiae TaxID=2942213 RepID=A0ABT0PID5_9GAMM|nr:3'(2'),5'-bisphosphate nucleotidase CysQ [Sansalvadorimonas sp. 2012CJ34-2]MCL6271159.1 3'(2'),5'-bisphosphate nucleotidase CysQ [Sansalvadorimonas sp. 2012CJ34-2]
MNIDNTLTDSLKELCRKAGDAILAVYDNNEISVTQKSDNSPITDADRKAHRIITDGLEQITRDIPVISEEGTIPPFEERSGWYRYWLVDPLDGTKEFIARTDEFTVNIALIEDGSPILGFVYSPVNQACYYGGPAMHGAWRQVASKAPEAIQTRPCAPENLLNVAVSRRHGRDQLVDLINRFEQRFSEVHLIVAGSSLKGMLVAEGTLDIYPRRGPTSEWDTAAQQAIVEAAGGKVLDVELNPLRYNQKDSLINPSFYVLGDPAAEWESLLM